MDSVTQFVLGAAVGEAVLGKKVGNKAIWWGAAAATVPDLDVVGSIFNSNIVQLGFHRGISHSFTFAVVAAPLMGYLIYKATNILNNRKRNAQYLDSENEETSIHGPIKGFLDIYTPSIRSWSWLAFWAFLTHILLDYFTMYGTQIFQPFSDYRAGLNSIFIIDPVYTIPLFLSFVIILRLKRNSKLRWQFNTYTLVITTFYLLITLVNKQIINSAFEKALNDQGLKYTRLFSMPTPFNNILWTGIAETDTSYFYGIYSMLDEDIDISFTEIPKNTHLIENHLNDNAVKELMWFSDGFYHISKVGSDIIFNDIRFGMSNFGLFAPGQKPEGLVKWYDNVNFIFGFKLVKSEDVLNLGEYVDYTRMSARMDGGWDVFGKLYRRIRGNKNP